MLVGDWHVIAFYWLALLTPHADISRIIALSFLKPDDNRKGEKCNFLIQTNLFHNNSRILFDWKKKKKIVLKRIFITLLKFCCVFFFFFCMNLMKFMYAGIMVEAKVWIWLEWAQRHQTYFNTLHNAWSVVGIFLPVMCFFLAYGWCV